MVGVQLAEKEQPQTRYPGLIAFAYDGHTQAVGRISNDLALATDCVRFLTPSLP